MARILEHFGVSYHLTCPHTSTHNGMVELRLRCVVDFGLAFLFMSHAPMKFWPFSFCSAIYTLNRIPPKVLKFSSPYTELFGISFDLYFLRFFWLPLFPMFKNFLQNFKTHYIIFDFKIILILNMVMSRLVHIIGSHK